MRRSLLTQAEKGLAFGVLREMKREKGEIPS